MFPFSLRVQELGPTEGGEAVLEGRPSASKGHGETLSPEID
jgi:hypothetical protein